MNWRDHIEVERAHLASEGRIRSIVDLDAFGHEGLLGERKVTSFASNDYLGLTSHAATIAAARVALERWGSGSGAARLIVGSRPPHRALEEAIARWKGTEKALLFPSGFAANVGVLTSLGTPDAVIVSDRLNHASIVDGCRAAAAEIAVFPHADAAAARAALDRHPGKRAIVVTDLVFSMDGDVAPVEKLAGMCRETGALLVLDEAHAVLGPEIDLGGVDALRVGTLSKFLGSAGGFVAGPGWLIDHLVNTARSFIFTTAGSPADAAAALAALEIYLSPEGDELKARLRANIDILAPGHPSPIVPVIVGDERSAVEAAAALLEEGFLVPAIRPPSVPPGSSRLRVTVSAAHGSDQVEALRDALQRATGWSPDV